MNSPTSITISVANLSETAALAARLAAALPAGTAVGLQGTLGAGKTQFVQLFAEALGVPDGVVNSPTYVLCQHYEGVEDRRVHHFDVYRLADEDEFLELGPEEYFDSDGITFVEWADRVAACLPRNRLEIAIEVTGESSRQFTLTKVGNVVLDLTAFG